MPTLQIGNMTMPTTAKLKKVVLNLARTREHPDGSIRHGYEIVAPLDDNGKIDTEAWKARKGLCVVHRFWGDEPRQRGQLVHRAGGPGGGTWAFDYDAGTDDDDEAGYRFGQHAFIEGEYVSIRDDEGELQTLKIIRITDA
jgi:hypothetical protein